MTTLAIAFFSTATAANSQGVLMECDDSRDCPGTGNYCYPSHPNYCQHGDGLGSICLSDDGCGGDISRQGQQMYCVNYRCQLQPESRRLNGDGSGMGSGLDSRRRVKIPFTEDDRRRVKIPFTLTSGMGSGLEEPNEDDRRRVKIPFTLTSGMGSGLEEPNEDDRRRVKIPFTEDERRRVKIPFTLTSGMGSGLEEPNEDDRRRVKIPFTLASGMGSGTERSRRWVPVTHSTERSRRWVPVTHSTERSRRWVPVTHERSRRWVPYTLDNEEGMGSGLEDDRRRAEDPNDLENGMGSGADRSGLVDMNDDNRRRQALSECDDSRDCSGTGYYCYPGHPNYCQYGDGLGSICMSDDGCGGDISRQGQKMYCVNYRCELYLVRRLNGDGSGMGSGLDESNEDNRRRVKIPFTLDNEDGMGSGLDEQRRAEDLIDFEDGMGSGIGSGVEQRRRAGMPTMPNPVHPPHHANECYGVSDCRRHGTSFYCYQGYYFNYCARGNGVGTLCRGRENCGWLGNSRKMYCEAGKCVDPWQGSTHHLYGGRRLANDNESGENTVVGSGMGSGLEEQPARRLQDNEIGEGSGLGSGLEELPARRLQDDNIEIDMGSGLGSGLEEQPAQAPVA